MLIVVEGMMSCVVESVVGMKTWYICKVLIVKLTMEFL